MKARDIGRAIAYPLVTPAVLIPLVVFWLLISFAIWGGVLGLFLLGRFVIEGSIGNAMAWTAGFLSLYVLWFLFKGHLLIANDRQAKLYWVQNDAGNREHCSNGAIVATMPAQEPMDAVRWAGNAAS
mgnify:CR=1 FL=1